MTLRAQQPAASNAQQALPAAPPLQVVLSPGGAPNTAATGLHIAVAVQRALDINPALRTQRDTVLYYQGSLDIQKSTFDTAISMTTNSGSTKTPLSESTIANAALYGITVRSQDTLSTQTQLGVSKVYRNGITVAPSLTLNRSSDNLNNTIGQITSSGGVQITIPLLRNRGKSVKDSAEIGARREVEAQGLQVAQVASTTIAQTVNAYWNYVGALQSLSAYRQSELRGQTLLENTQETVKADVVPRSELNFASANLASRTSSRANAEQSVVQAAQSLATSIGVPADQVLTVAAPSDPLPVLTSDANLPVTPEALLGYVKDALKNRADYQVAQTRVAEYAALRHGTKGMMLPQLDAALNAGYSGLQDNGRFDKFFGVAFQNTAGPNLTGSVTFNFPPANNYYRGQYEQEDSLYRQSIDTVLQTGNAIASAVVTAANGLNTSATQLRYSHAATEGYRVALEGEREKLRFGQSSLLDILQSEDRYIQAQLTEIQAQVTYANAIASFRYSMGTYVDLNRPSQMLSQDAFYRAQTTGSSPTEALPPGPAPGKPQEK